MFAAAKAALDPVQLRDRAARGFRAVELHLTPASLGVPPACAARLLARFGLEAVSVHAPRGVCLGAGGGLGALALVARLADAVVPAGAARRVVVHPGPDLPLGLPLRVRLLARSWALRRAARDLAALGRSVALEGGPVLWCVENHVWCWLEGCAVHAVAGRFPEEFRLLGALVEEEGAGQSLGFCLDVCHASSVAFATGGCVGLEDFLAAMGPRLAVVHLCGARGLAAARADHGLPLGEGDLGLLRGLARRLSRAGFSGPVVCEVLEPDPRFAPGMERTARWWDLVVESPVLLAAGRGG